MVDLQAFDKSFEPARYMMKIGGLQLLPKSPAKITNWSDRFVVYHLKYYVFLFIFWGMFLQIVYFVQQFGNNSSFLEVTEIVPCIGCCTFALTKMCAIWRRNSETFDLVNNLKAIWPGEFATAAEMATLDACMKKIRVINKAYILLFFVLVFIYDVTAMVEMLYNYLTTGHTKLLLPYYIWTPFDAYSPIAYPIVYILFVLASIGAIVLSAGVDVLFLTINAQLCMHLEFIQLSLEHIVEQAAGGDVSSDIDGKRHDALNALLNQCVKRHSLIIELANTLEEIYNPSFLVNFLGSSIIICVAGFQLTAAASFDLFKFVAFLLSYLVQIFTVCYSGNQLIITSTNVGEAAYRSAWYLTDARFRRSLLIIMSRAQRPLLMTAMKFSPLSLASASTILKTSYSYFTLLRTVYESPE